MVAMLDWGPLEQACMACQKCALADTRHNVVFGTGVRNAEVMFIGEGPGENEDLQGEPFVGRGGKLLDDMLETLGLDRCRLARTNSRMSRPRENRHPTSPRSTASGLKRPAPI